MPTLRRKSDEYGKALDALTALGATEPDPEKVSAWYTAAHNLENAAREEERQIAEARRETVEDR